MDSPKYFTLHVEFAPGVWSPEFGDFDRAVVVTEMFDRLESYDLADNGDDLRRNNYKIISE